MAYLAEIPARVSGIPCLIGVEHYQCTPPHRGSPYSCDSDWDYYGYTECDWRILDRRGRPASWLEQKLTHQDRERIKEEINAHFDEEKEYRRTEAAIARFESRYDRYL
jgi:hypothetical protein